MNGLSATTKNILSIVGDIPVMILKKDSGRNKSERVCSELKSLSGKDFQVFENDSGICIIAKGSGRTFLV